MKKTYSKITGAASKLIRVLRAPRRLWNLWLRQKDCFDFSRRYAPIFRPSPTGGGKTAAVISLIDFPQQNKVEGLLAKTLSERGYSPVIVTSRNCRFAIQYFKAFGFSNFLFFEDLIDRETKKKVVREARRILSQGLNFGTLFALRSGGIDIGRHFLSTMTRNLREGSVDTADPAIRAALEEQLVKSLEAAAAARRLWSEIRPEVALFNERGYTPYGEISDEILHQGGQVIQWVGAQSKNSMLLKRYTAGTREVHPFSVGRETWEKIVRMRWTDAMENEILDEMKGRYENGTWFDRKYLSSGKRLKDPAELRRQLRLDPAKKTAVLFSHVLWDATFFYGQNLFENYEQWLLETIQAASENPRVNWVVKLHPDYVWKLKLMKKEGEVRDLAAIKDRFGALPEHIRLILPETDISTYSLFAISDYCLTVRGTVGIEMSCFGIPVFTAGTGRYSGLGFTNDSENRDEYLDKVRRIDQFPPLSRQQQKLARRHAYALFRLRPWNFNSFEMVYGSLADSRHPLLHDAQIHLASQEDFKRAPDLNAFADLVTRERSEDFLNRLPIEQEQTLPQSSLASIKGSFA